MPEVALFKSTTYEAYAELQIHTIDRASGEPFSSNRRAAGAAAYNQYTLLILVNFTRSDLDEPNGAGR